MVGFKSMFIWDMNLAMKRNLALPLRRDVWFLNRCDCAELRGVVLQNDIRYSIKDNVRGTIVDLIVGEGWKIKWGKIIINF